MPTIQRINSSTSSEAGIAPQWRAQGLGRAQEGRQEQQLVGAENKEKRLFKQTQMHVKGPFTPLNSVQSWVPTPTKEHERGTKSAAQGAPPSALAPRSALLSPRGARPARSREWASHTNERSLRRRRTRPAAELSAKVCAAWMSQVQ